MKTNLPHPLEIHDLTVGYNQKPVLYGIDVEVEEGSLVGIIGPNGAGKSTLIKTVMGMLKAEDGYVKIFGETGKKSNHACRVCSSAGKCGLGLPGHGHGCCSDGEVRSHQMVPKGKQERPFVCIRMPRANEYAPLCGPPNWQSFRRAATTGILSPCSRPAE